MKNEALKMKYEAFNAAMALNIDSKDKVKLIKGLAGLFGNGGREQR
jgi:hypothetical protein